MKKQPKQKRSQALVEAILDASTRVLSKTKLSQMTTNNVAEVAGVSIGSLYDYFPNKNSIVVALMDNRMQAQLDGFFALLDHETTIEGVVDAVMNMIENDYLTKKDFMREVFMLAPENGRMEALFLNRIKAQKRLAAFMTDKLGRDQAWAEKKSFVLVNAILGLIETYIILDEVPASAEDLKKEMRLMMISTLAAD